MSYIADKMFGCGGRQAHEYAVDATMDGNPTWPDAMNQFTTTR
jgi:hypothetical protein